VIKIHLFSYNSSGLLSRGTNDFFNGDSWINVNLYEMQYDGNGNLMDSVFYDNWVYDEWYRISKTSYTRNGFGQPLTKVYVFMMGGEEFPQDSSVYTYYDNGKLKTKFTGLNGGHHQLDEYFYSEDGKLEERKFQQGDQYSYYAPERYIFEYDSYGNLLGETYQRYSEESSQYENEVQYKHTYDHENNLTGSEVLEYTNNDWQLTQMDRYLEIPISPYAVGAVKTEITYSLINVDELVDDRNVPLEIAISDNFPNPFNPYTTVMYAISKKSRVSLKIYDLLGREVMEVFNKEVSAGLHQEGIMLEGFASGAYIYVLQAEDHIACGKMMLIK
jgi:hypothetical protein